MEEEDDDDNKESEEGAPTPSPPPPLIKTCDCTSDYEEDDFHNEEWVDSRWLNTIKRPWVTVFPKRGDVCCFCRELLPYGQLDKEECDDCAALSTFQLVKKHAPRWRYTLNIHVFLSYLIFLYSLFNLKYGL